MRITDSEIKYNNVKSAPDTLIAMGETSTEDIKNIFDRLPELVAKKHNALVDYVNEVLKSPEGEVANIKMYSNPSQAGASYDSSIDEMYRLTPINSLMFLRPARITHESWNLPTLEGFITLLKGETLGKIILWGRSISNGIWVCQALASGVPTGQWTKIADENALESVREGIDFALQSAREADSKATQAGYDASNSHNILKAELDSLEADLGVVTNTQYDKINLASETLTAVATKVLPAGNHIVQFGGYFSSNSNGWRKVHIGTNADGTVTTSRRFILIGNAVNGKPTYLSNTTFIALSKETTLYMFAEHNAGSDVGFYGYLNSMQITGETVVLPDLSGGGSGGIYG